MREKQIHMRALFLTIAIFELVFGAFGMLVVFLPPFFKLVFLFLVVLALFQIYHEIENIYKAIYHLHQHTSTDIVER